MNYKPLGTTFQKNGFRFKQLFREGDIALFHKVHLNPAHDGGFEVVQISRHDGYEIAGNKVEPAEMYPNSESWGVKGFTYPDLFHAETKFEKLKSGDNSPEIPDEPAQLEDTSETSKPARRPRGAGLPEITFPEGEFSIKEVAALNPTVNPATVYLCVKAAVESGKIQPTRQERRSEKGKLTQLFRVA